jgi:hypothetical protein
MRLTFVGTNSNGGSCPAVYKTDRGTVVVQGWKLAEGDQAWGDLQNLADNETALEIPLALLPHLRNLE